MTLKKRLIFTAIWTFVMFVVGGIGVWWIGTHPVRGVRPEARAAQLGTGVATVMGIGYAVLWLPYAAEVGKKRRAEREATRKKKSRPKRR